MDDLAARLRAGIAASGQVDDEAPAASRFAQPPEAGLAGEQNAAGSASAGRNRASADVVLAMDRLFATVGLDVVDDTAGDLQLITASGAHAVELGTALIVGRNPDPPGLAVDRGDVSKNHLRIEHDGEGWTVTDLGSTNGTSLERDGARYRLPERQPVGLIDGDVLEVPSGVAHSRVELAR